MRIEWVFEASDAEAVKEEVKKFWDTAIVKERRQLNLAEKKTCPTRDDFWKASVQGVLTSVQRYDRIEAFLDADPFPLSFKKCADCEDLSQKVTGILAKVEGLRFKGKRRADYLCANFSTIRSDKWKEIQAQLQQLADEQTMQRERKVAEFIASLLEGIGPKQSRNILQMLHLTRYEIPIDSRITNWLEEIGCPVRLSAGLADYGFYLYVETKIQELCDMANVMPCVFDAAIWAANAKKKKALSP